MSPKKKNTIYTVVGISAVVIVLIIMNFFHVFNCVSCNPVAGKAQITVNGKTVTASDDDSARLKELLYGRDLHYDSPSCGFREDINVSFGFDKFFPACDNCGIIQNNGKYMYLTDEETDEFHEIVKKYGMGFPCL